MYQADQIITAFAGMVGILQPDDPQYPSIDAALTTSTVGKYLQNIHPLCTIENIVNCAPEFENFVYPAWVSGKAYVSATIVNGPDNILYQCILAVTSATTPANDATHWQICDPFSNWLKRLYNQACTNLVSEYLIMRKYEQKGRSLLELQMLYQGPGTVSNKIIKTGRFVCLQISLASALGIILRLDRIGFQCDTPQAELNFYLYHSSLTDPIFVIPVAIAANSNFTWSTVTNKLIGFLKNNANTQGTYYFGYYESDLVGQAISKDINLSVAPCQTCNQYDIAAYDKWSKYSSLQAGYVPAIGLYNDNSLPDLSKFVPGYNTNWGINLGFAMMCDYTDAFVMNKSVFVDPLSKRLALEFINQIAFTNRIGVIADKTRKLAIAELDEKMDSGSFRAEYLKCLMALDWDMSGFNAACLPNTDRIRINRDSI